MKRVYLLLWAGAVAILAFVTLDMWNARNAPLYRRFEKQWAEDLALLEDSRKLPKSWADVREVEVFGGSPEAKAWLRQIEIPVRQKNPAGQHKLEILVVPWQEDGKSGVMLQYNLVDLKSQNMIFELGRTLVLHPAEEWRPW